MERFYPAVPEEAAAVEEVEGEERGEGMGEKREEERGEEREGGAVRVAAVGVAVEEREGGEAPAGRVQVWPAGTTAGVGMVEEVVEEVRGAARAAGVEEGMEGMMGDWPVGAVSTSTRCACRMTSNKTAHGLRRPARRCRRRQIRPTR